VLTEGPLTNLEITQHLKEVMDSLKDSSGAIIKFVYPMPRHPLMWLELASSDLYLLPSPLFPI
jgi:hypothetical protein